MKKFISRIKQILLVAILSLQSGLMVYADDFADNYPHMNPTNVPDGVKDELNKILGTATTVMNYVAVFLTFLTMIALAIAIVRLILDGDEHPIINLECRKNIYSCIIILACIGGFRFIVGLLFTIIAAVAG